MNKIASILTGDLHDGSISELFSEAGMSDSDKLFLKQRMEDEIRMQLDQFAKELSQARRNRQNK